MTAPPPNGTAVLIVFPPEASALVEALGAAHAGEALFKVALGEVGPEHRDARRVDPADPAAMGSAVAALPPVDTIYFLGGLDTSTFAVDDFLGLARSQQLGVLSLFRLVKALHRQLATRDTRWRIITADAHPVAPGDRCQPAGASIHGFLRAMTQEYPRAAIGAFDLSPSFPLSRVAGAPADARAVRELVAPVLATQLAPGLTVTAVRGGVSYGRALEAVALPEAPHPPFRRGGAYVVLGGAGGIGTVVSRWLAETYQAKLVWVGRRALDAVRQSDREAIERAGGQLHYVQADATDPQALAAALDEIRPAVGGVFHGGIHSAIVLRDQRIERLDESDFLRALAPKVQGSVALYRALQHDPLDFLLFFSSAQSFAANAGQSNYAAGCAFKDAFAAWLGERCAFPVRTVNWGYWGSVGIVASEAYRKKLESFGVLSIEPDEGIETVRRVLSHSVPQIMAFKGTDELLADIGVVGGYQQQLMPAAPALFDEITAALPAHEDDPGPWLAIRALGRQGLLSALGALRAFAGSGEQVEVDELRRRLRLKPTYARLYQALLAMLVDCGALLRDGSLLTVTELGWRGSQVPLAEIDRQRVALSERHPPMRALIELLARCLTSLPEVLPGVRPATEVLFPGSSMHLLEDIYKNNATADHYNRVVAEVARRYVQARLRDGGQTKVRLLEVGAGTGGTSAHVLPVLAEMGAHLEYVYTDVSRAFLAHGKKHFVGAFPFVSTALLDLERDPEAQGIVPGSFDLVLGTNVLHATRRLGNTIGHLKVALRRNGVLLVNEATSVEEFNTLIFGLLDGWWAYEDESLRLPNAPLLGVAQWKAILAAEGFPRVAALGAPAPGLQIPSAAVMVAEGDGLVRRPRAASAVHRVPASAVPATGMTDLFATVASPAPAAPAIRSQRLAVRAVALQAIAEVLDIPADRIDVDERFADLGVDSVLSVEIARRIGDQLQIELRSTELFNHSSVADLARHLETLAPRGPETPDDRPVALPAVLDLPAAPAPRPVSNGAGPAPVGVGLTRQTGFERTIAAAAAGVLDVDPASLDRDESFADFGVDSVLAVEIINRINSALGADLRSTDLFNHASVRALAAHLSSVLAEGAEVGGVVVAGASDQSEARSAPADASLLFAPKPATAAAPAVVSPVADEGSSDFPDLDDLPAPSVSERPPSLEATVGQPTPAISAGGPAAVAVAIIGMSGRFPAARDVETYWNNLRAGRDCISDVPRSRWDLEAFFAGHERRSSRAFPSKAGLIDDVDAFDSLFFGISPKEAEMMDPQQRLFLEEAWKALEDAGQSQRMLSERRCGVYVGCGAGDYRVSLRQAGVVDEPFTLMGNSTSILPARLSYLLNLRGPSIALDTACSSSLVAVHLACEAIASGSLEMAVAGGTMVLATPEFALLANEAGMLAPDGRCKAFDDAADGFVPAEGVGVLVLKSLEAALRDGDPIAGVIPARGSAINQDGKTNGITAPSGPAQTALELDIYRASGISPELLDYVEAHGTGTRLGDPIEIQALTDAFGRYSQRRQWCAIGSVKANIGHAAMAAGVAGVIKVLLAMRHAELPPAINFREPNAQITFAETPFFVPTAPVPWPARPDRPRRAAVSSFGFSGTNAHLLLEEAPARPVHRASRGAQVIVLSARTEAALARRISDLLAWIERAPGETSLAEVAYTLMCRRTPMPLRLALVASSLEDLRAQLAMVRDGQQTPAPVSRGDLKGAPPQIEALHEELGCRMIAELAASGTREEGSSSRQLRALGDLFVRGYDLPWSQLYPGARALNLPTYSFERHRHWVAGRVEPVAAAPVAAAPPAAFLMLEKAWLPSVWPTEGSGPSGTMVILANEESAAFAGRLAAGELSVAGADLRWLVVVDGTGPGAEDGRLRADLGHLDDGRRLAETLLSRVPDLAGVLDLADLYRGSRAAPSASAGRLALYQGLIRAAVEGRRNEPFLVLHFTRGLAAMAGTAGSLAGAVIAGLMRPLSAEYQRVVARTVDLDFGPERDGALAATIATELLARDPVAEICVRDGARYLPTLRERLRLPPEALAADTSAAQADGLFTPDKVLVITGGTGGIGRTLARRAVARGVRKLAILGLDSIPERERWDELLADPAAPAEQVSRVQEFLELERAGCALELYLGRLTDAARLGAFFERVRRRLGPVRGVIHCAGAFVDGHPPFIHRELEDVPRVLEAKVDGLLALEAALAGDPVEQFLLFSSISAVFPSLAIGIADYSIANSFLASFAEQRFAAGQRQYQALIWSNWRDVGIGEVDNANYRQLALQTHSSPQGLQMLDRAVDLLGTAPTLTLSLFDPERFSPERLLSPRQDQQEKVTFVRGDENLRRQVAASGQIDGGSRRWLRDLFARELKIPEDDLDDRVRFEQLGIDSILMVDLLKKIESALGEPLDPTAFLEYPSLEELGKYLQVKHGERLQVLAGAAVGAADRMAPAPAPSPAPVPTEEAPRPIPARSVAAAPSGRVAVIGIACHFPKSPDHASFWRNLCAGFDGIDVVPPLRFAAEEIYSPVHEPDKSISKWGGFIEGIDWFDPGYFGLREEVAPQIDPLIRQFLETAVQCFRDAGYQESELSRRRVGVFVGSRVSSYSRRIERALADTVVGVGQNFIASHVSHLLNLRGPSMVVDTACSSSLVGLHLACQSLASGDSDLVLAGGVDLLLDEIPFVTLSEARALSPEGRCFTFDERANGFVPGEGSGAVLLKPLEKALADGDRIYAVIEGSAINNDGRTMGITTPNPDAQAEVISEALHKAGASADSVSYVEAHGTGTMIGDPIELRGLTKAFRAHTEDRQFCAVGSVKSNIGHLFSAAGMASFIKVALCLHHKRLVPTINCQRPNPRFAFEQSPFYPSLHSAEWAPRAGTRRAGISSFGFGGTNAHLVMRELSATEAAGRTEERPPRPPVVFQRKRFWLERQAPGADRAERGAGEGGGAAEEPLPGLLELEWIEGGPESVDSGAVSLVRNGLGSNGTAAFVPASALGGSGDQS